MLYSISKIVIKSGWLRYAPRNVKMFFGYHYLKPAVLEQLKQNALQGISIQDTIENMKKEIEGEFNSLRS